MIKLILLLFITSSMVAQFAGDPRESWYIHTGIGIAQMNYPDKLDLLIDNFDQDDQFRRNELFVDLIGIYGHVDEQLLLGGNISFAADRIEDADSFIQFNMINVNVSSYYYFNRAFFGEGFFVRSDLGLTYAGTIDDKDNVTKTDYGIGLTFAGGYSADIIGTRILMYGLYSHRVIESDSYTNTALMIGFLF